MSANENTLSVRVELALRDFTLDVAFDVPPGVTVLFGPSGAGKSRTLACIAGIQNPDRGRIAFGDDVWFEGRRSLAIERRRVAYVFQSLALFPHMTAEQNVAYGVDRTLNAAARDAHAKKMLERMHVPHLIGRKPRTYSGGEAQRVALARAFAMNPRVLLLDEPFSALDEGVKKELMTDAAEWIEREKIPTILVTHHAEEARILGKRTVLLDKGKVAASREISS